MQPPQNPGPPYPPSFGQTPRPNWFRRATPAGRVAVILGSVTLSLLLLCCTGTAIVGALTGEPEPTKTGTAAEQPVLAAPGEPTEEAPAQEESPIAAPSSAPATAPSSAAAVPVVQVTTVTEQATIRYGERTVKDSSLAEGKRVVRSKGVNGVRTLTYEVTTTDGVRTNKKLVKSAVTKQPVTQVVAVGTKKPQSSKCDPNYSGCVPIASDVDCAGGSGNGPAYVSGPIRVIGDDIYDLDRDGDGIACD
ncbi:G5 domain-containing protein [Micromonospora noduli]|uniref:G5 domain-containing protein n=1 Tax=Micromonospora noduli TaxID=709876 RepID=UPI000DC228C4|nr:G5 domain-containing protein [Micromonospora noduli]RAO18739.1 N-acetylmuramoyl-L-alanine amidase [Micromonospora noduli]